jgi:hypothetical protein
MTSAVWFPTAEMLFFVTATSSPVLASVVARGLFVMGMLNGWELTSHLQNILFQMILLFLQMFAIWHSPVHSSSQL